MKKRTPLRHIRYDFLPSALEIVESPHSPLARAVLWILVAFIGIAGVWMYVGEIDEVAIARGVIKPTGNVKVVQAVAGGRIAALHVKNGDVVTKGQPVITLDSSENTIEIQRLAAQIASAETEKALLQQAVRGVDISGRLADAKLTDDAKQSLVSFYQQRTSILRGRLSSARSSLDRAQAALRAEQISLESRQKEVEQARQDVQRAKDQTTSDDERKERAIDTAHRAEQAAQSRYRLQQNRLQQASIAVEAAQKDVENSARTNEATDFSVIVEKDKQLIDLRAQLERAKHAAGQSKLTAPVAGTVHAMEVSTEGAVIEPAKTLMTIVPADSELIVEARLKNKDAAFVQTGDAVAVKVDTYAFQRYGTIEGTVIGKSADAVATKQDGLVYTLTIQLDTDDARRQKMQLTSGMSLTAEVITGRKKIIDFILDPVTQRVDEALKVR